jgi:hypothetical protein
MKKIWLRASKKMKLLIFYQAWKHLVTCNGTHDHSRWGISWERTHSNMHSNWGPANPWKKCPRRWHLKAFRLRIRSCLGVSHKFLRKRTKLLEIALVCIKEPLRQKNSHFAALNDKNMVAGE